MAKKRMVTGWPCWFWMDADGVIQQFNDQKAPPRSRKGWVLHHDDASLYELAPGLAAPWMNHDGTTRLLLRPIPVNDIEPVSLGELAKTVEPDPEAKAFAGALFGDEPELDEWAALDAEIEAEEKAKAKK